MKKKTDKQKFGEWLKKIRMKTGMTLREYSKYRGWGSSFISYIENGLYDLWDTKKVLKKYPPAFPKKNYEKENNKEEDT